tara:strand:+ start:2648 stop:3961 length:1314 start_codon:yes stop_codon:yes gene_type:complete
MEVKILDKEFVGDVINTDGIRITLSKSIDIKTGRKTVQLVKSGLVKLKEKRILDTVKRAFQNVVILHENEFENYKSNTKDAHLRFGNRLDLDLVNGLYVDSHNLIIMMIKNNHFSSSEIEKYFINTFIHEIGHGIHMNCLSKGAHKFFNKTFSSLFNFNSICNEINQKLGTAYSDKSKKIFNIYLEKYINSLIKEKITNKKAKENEAASILQSILSKKFDILEQKISSALVENRKLFEDMSKMINSEDGASAFKDEQSIDSLANTLVYSTSIYSSLKLFLESLGEEDYKIEPYLSEEYDEEVDDKLLEDCQRVIKRLFKELEKIGIDELTSLIKKRYNSLVDSFGIHMPERIFKVVYMLGRYIDTLFPTEYSQKNEMENFAECFLYWVTGDDRLRLFDRYRMQYTMSISKAGGRQIRSDNYLRNYIKLILETKIIQL